MTINEKKPSLLLWLFARITIVALPLSVLLEGIVTRLGMREDVYTFIMCVCFSLLITQWYEDLNEEVTDYIRKHYK